MARRVYFHLLIFSVTKMKLRIIIILLPIVTSLKDPCKSRYLLDDGGRSSSCDLRYKECDRYIKERWYHSITLDNDLTIPTSCVDVLKCGTVYPIWMNGSLPLETDGIVNRTACVSTPGNCCHHSYNIMVKNCVHFFTFYLIRAAGCPERYCFGTSNQCPTTTTTMKTTTSSSKLPIFTDPSSATQSSQKTATILSSRFRSNESLCPSSFVFLALSACLMGTTVGLAVNLLLRIRRDRRVDADRENKHCIPPKKFMA